MFKFMREVSSMTGKHFMAGTIVPDGFSTPAGLAEMVKAGDIEEVGAKIEKAAPGDVQGDQTVPPVSATSPKMLTIAEVYALCDKAGVTPDSLELGGPENMTPAKVKAAIKKAVAAKKAA